MDIELSFDNKYSQGIVPIAKLKFTKSHMDNGGRIIIVSKAAGGYVNITPKISGSVFAVFYADLNSTFDRIDTKPINITDPTRQVPIIDV